MKLRRIDPGTVAMFLALVWLLACYDKKQMATAKANAVEYALAQCECEKLARKEPPGDTTQCTERMSRATRYMKINFELGKFTDAARAEVDKVGKEAYIRCLADGSP